MTVYDKDGRLFGRGLFNPRSQIALRMLTWGDVAIDDTFWRRKLAAALELRRRLRLDDVSDAYRLVHAEGDGLSGLIAERYADTLGFELFSLGMYQRIDTLTKLLSELLGPPPASTDRASLTRPGASWSARTSACSRSRDFEWRPVR